MAPMDDLQKNQHHLSQFFLFELEMAPPSINSQHAAPSTRTVRDDSLPLYVISFKKIMRSHHIIIVIQIPWVKLIWFHYYNSGKLPGQNKKGSFWWRDIVKLLGKFKSMSSVIVAEGNSVLFWKDRWIGQPLDLTYPELFSFVKNGNVTFKSVASNFEVSGIFNLPLSTQAHQQLNLLHQSLSNRQIRDGVDTWVYCWGNSIFSTSKTYKFLSSGALAHPVFRWIWKSRCQMKHKVFFWLLLVNRLNTRGLLQRRGMILDSYTCDLCILQLLETNAHLFLQCNFDKACWNSIGVNYSSSVTVLQIFEKNQERPGTPFLHGDNHSFSLEYLAN
jgi:hypothetical protein